MMVPSKRLELLRLSALPPQDSVSTNSTTTANRKFALPQVHAYFGISVDFSAGAAGAAGAGAEGAGAAGFTSSFWSAGTSSCWTTLPDFDGAPKYVSPRLVAKNTAARTAVERDRKLAAPAEPNRL